MHIDACVFVGTSCVRFEIDGEAHFTSLGTERDWRDVEKDSVFRLLGVGLVHLHWRDEQVWLEYIRHALCSHNTALVYTPTFKECLEAHENVAMNY